MHIILYILCLTTILLYCFCLFLSLTGLLKAITLSPSKPTSTLNPHVAILRPLKGLDLNLESNLKSSFLQSYSNKSIYFCIEFIDDPAIAIVNSLIKQFPNINSHIIIGRNHSGVNPKVDSLLPAFNQINTDIIWIVDSNIYLNNNACSRSVDLLLKEGVGLGSCF